MHLIGKESKPFYVKLGHPIFIDDVPLYSDTEINIQIIKVYKDTWWRRLLKNIGFNIRINEAKVVKIIKHNEATINRDTKSNT